MATCCNLVGNFDITAEGIISISSKGSTETTLFSAGGTSAVAVAPSTGTVSISAYASFSIHTGCPGKIGVSIPWIRRSDCDSYKYLFGGYGQSYITNNLIGNLNDLSVSFPSITGVDNPVAEYEIVEASASSGPASVYTVDTQRDGYGLIYRGLPWNIDTTTEEGCTVDLSFYGIGDYGKCKLQSLDMSFTGGQLPIVNMSFIYSI